MIKVLQSGFYTSIQDNGRAGFASIGVPVSGVMDQYSADLANSILNNNLEAAVLEITFGGCKLEFLTETVICISGGDFSPKINDNLVSLNSRIKVAKNDVLLFGKINFGARCYLAVKEGFLSEKVLKSKSFYKNITKQFLVKKDDVLLISVYKSELETSNASIKKNTNHFSSQEINCYKGPEFNLLSDVQKQQLEKQIFSISNDNNRMGYRLNETIDNELGSILTSAVLPGTVQLTPSGNLIVLMRDCQVTGGYPRVLQLSAKGINRLAQKTTGNIFEFVIN